MQRFGAVCRVLCGGWVLCGCCVDAKQTSKGLAWCLVLSKDKVRVPNKQGISVGATYQAVRSGCGHFGVLCGGGAKQTS